MKTISRAALLPAVLAMLSAGPVFAHDNGTRGKPQPCPVDYYGGVPMDVEFGPGAEESTHCLTNRRKAKVLVAIDHAHPRDKNGNVRLQQATFLSNIEHMIQNYEVIHGMEIGKDVDVVVVGSTSGALLLTTHHPAWGLDEAGNPKPNPFRHLVERGLEKGMKFYLCQTASRQLGIDMETKIPGVQFVPGGHIAVADFQLDGYALIRP